MVGDYGSEEFNSGDGSLVRDNAVFAMAHLYRKLNLSSVAAGDDPLRRIDRRASSIQRPHRIDHAADHVGLVDLAARSISAQARA
jgi:hypothetical protein